MSAVSAPILVMISVFMGLVLVVLSIVFLAGTGVTTPAGSTALVSTGSTLTGILPYIGIIVGSGFFFLAIDSSRRRS